MLQVYFHVVLTESGDEYYALDGVEEAGWRGFEEDSAE